MPQRMFRSIFIVAATLIGGVAALFIQAWLMPVQAPLMQPNVDFIIVSKHDHRLSLFRKGRLVQAYAVALGRGGQGAKTRASDNKVPEGLYSITGRNARSAFHLALRIGYPTPAQTQLAQSHGVDPGGNVMIHGLHRGMGWLGALHRQIDWTRGCIAVTDDEIEAIWRDVPNGTPIRIEA